MPVRIWPAFALAGIFYTGTGDVTITGSHHGLPVLALYAVLNRLGADGQYAHIICMPGVVGNQSDEYVDELAALMPAVPCQRDRRPEPAAAPPAGCAVTGREPSELFAVDATVDRRASVGGWRLPGCCPATAARKPRASTGARYGGLLRPPAAVWHTGSTSTVLARHILHAAPGR